MTTTRRAGRPPNTGIDLIQAQTWVRRLMQVSGLHTGHALEVVLEPKTAKKSADGVARPKKWQAYIKGRRCPRRIANRRYSIDIAENAYPGTRAVFESPAWRFLDGQRLTPSEIDQGLRDLGPNITTWVLDGQRNAVLPNIDARRAGALAGLGNVEALLAIILLIARADAIASAELREIALAAYGQIQPALLQQPLLAPVLPDLFLAVDTRCKHWAHVTNQTRMEIVIFSDAVREALDAEIDGGTPLIRTVKTTPKTKWDAEDCSGETTRLITATDPPQASPSTATQRQRGRVQQKE